MPKQKPNEQVQQIPLSEIRPFKNHPFKVTDDELMQQTIDSIMQVGVLNPAIIRPAPEGGYEMVSGHRRLHAADLAGLKTIPAIVRNLDDDEAVILMVDSNLQRETISPMERAQAYKMKLEALKHQGKRVDLEGKSTSRQLVGKLETADKVGELAGDSGRQPTLKLGGSRTAATSCIFTTASTLITISTQAGVGTPLIFVAAFTNYNTKRVTATTNIRAFILVPP